MSHQSDQIVNSQCEFPVYVFRDSHRVGLPLRRSPRFVPTIDSPTALASPSSVVAAPQTSVPTQTSTVVYHHHHQQIAGSIHYHQTSV
jgi:hypothetical protein